MKTVLAVLVMCSLASSACGQVLFTGGCPNVTVQDNFDITKYMGRWYENRRFFAIFQAFTDCVTAEYQLLEDGSVLVNNTGTSKLRFFSKDRTVTAIGNAKAEGDNPAKLGVRFSDAQPRGDYWVLSTDYVSYSIVVACSPIKLFGRTLGNYQFAWILTRNRYGVSEQQINELLRILHDQGIDVSKFTITNQANCPRYGSV